MKGVGRVQTRRHILPVLVSDSVCGEWGVGGGTDKKT